MQHHVADGFSGLHFINSWSDVARGVPIAIQPFIDRTLLRARDPPSPSFSHIEYQPPPAMASTSPSTEPATKTLPPTAVNIFRLTRSQLGALREKLPPTAPYFSTYALLAAHVWCCTCRARGLPPDQMTKMYIATDGRARLRPPLSEGYFGNVIFTATPIASCEEILVGGAEKIQNALARMDDKYCR
jgi:shikimate O-hydroxycinnamoyltransferase